METKIFNYTNSKIISFSYSDIIFYIDKIEKIDIDYEILFKYFLKHELSYITNLSFIKDIYNEEDLLNVRIHHVFKEKKYTKNQINIIIKDLHDLIKEEFINIMHYMIKNKLDFTYNSYNNFHTQNLFFSFKTKIEDIIYNKFNQKIIIKDFKFGDYYFSEITKKIFNLFHNYLNSHIKDIIFNKIKNIDIEYISKQNIIKIDTFELKIDDLEINYKNENSFFNCQNHLISGFFKKDNSIKLISFIDSSLSYYVPLYLSYFVKIKNFDISFDVNFYFDEKIEKDIFEKLFNLNRLKI